MKDRNAPTNFGRCVTRFLTSYLPGKKNLSSHTIRSYSLALRMYIRSKKKGRPKQGRTRNMLNRLSVQSHEVLAFMKVSPALFDNNQAELDLRMVKVKQKISGVFLSAKGANIFCQIRGYISTTRKNSVSAFDAIRSAYQGTPFMPEF
jgi:hypothetical protein